MNLSKIEFNLSCPQVKKDLANPHSLHRTLMSAFPFPLPQDERVLFRVEGVGEGEQPHVLVQSRTVPRWEEVLGKFPEYCRAEPALKSFSYDSLQAGAYLRFRLRANPCKRVFYERNKKSQRISLFSESDRREWLLRKAQLAGFSIDLAALIITQAPYRTLFISKEEKTHKATINMVDFNGVLRVDDVEKLKAALTKGIGPAKGLGCGLLSIAR